MRAPFELMALGLFAALVGGVVAALVVGAAQRRRRAGPAGGGASGWVDAGVVDSVVAVADERLGATHGLIDGQLRSLSDELGRVTAVVSRLEADRSRQHGELSAQLRATVDQTASLATTAGALRQVLANPKARGQWGERIADDVLRAAGLVEGISYVKQRATASGSVPDFSIVLPRGLVVHLDAKFPVANYARCLEATSDHEQALHRCAFLKDVRARVRELGGRGYVDPAGGTVGFVLAFIPNESIYAFVHEHDPGLLDAALAQGVVLCSPLTLFAVLAVVRQAVEAFAVESTASEIVGILGDFSDQWERFCASLDRMGRAVDGIERAFGELSGTRRRGLERTLARIEELRGRRAPPSVERARVRDGLRSVQQSAPFSSWAGGPLPDNDREARSPPR
ncbi:MAG: DNA recombination protein RmuC [Actinobacteria bacterium]|nr:DNA recombination protein RmuC [Actinomycetota bacterium]